MEVLAWIGIGIIIGTVGVVIISIAKIDESNKRKDNGDGW